jgi:aromatic-amino-acid transaminase
MTDATQESAVDGERRGASGLLAARVSAWNEAARPLGLRYPRYEGGFFVTVESADPKAHAAALREKEAFVVPLATSLRVALCSVATRHVATLARTMSEIVR